MQYDLLELVEECRRCTTKGDVGHVAVAKGVQYWRLRVTVVHGIGLHDVVMPAGTKKSGGEISGNIAKVENDSQILPTGAILDAIGDGDIIGTKRQRYYRHATNKASENPKHLTIAASGNGNNSATIYTAGVRIASIITSLTANAPTFPCPAQTRRFPVVVVTK